MAYEPVVLPFAGKAYTIAAGERMRAIGEVEEVLSLEDLGAMLRSRKFQAKKLSEAAGAALRIAGAEATPEEIYAHWQREDGKHRVLECYQMAYLLFCLMALLQPPESVVKLTVKGKAGAAGEGAAPSPSSTSSSSGTAG